MKKRKKFVQLRNPQGSHYYDTRLGMMQRCLEHFSYLTHQQQFWQPKQDQDFFLEYFNFRHLRWYPGSEAVPFMLVPRVISAFKMAGGLQQQFNLVTVGREMFLGEMINDLPDQLNKKKIRKNGSHDSHGSHHGSHGLLACRFGRPYINFLKHIDDYGSCSGLKINQEKSEIIVLGNGTYTLYNKKTPFQAAQRVEGSDNYQKNSNSQTLYHSFLPMSCELDISK